MTVKQWRLDSLELAVPAPQRTRSLKREMDLADVSGRSVALLAIVHYRTSLLDEPLLLVLLNGQHNTAPGLLSSSPLTERSLNGLGRYTAHPFWIDRGIWRLEGLVVSFMKPSD